MVSDIYCSFSHYLRLGFIFHPFNHQPSLAGVDWATFLVKIDLMNGNSEMRGAQVFESVSNHCKSITNSRFHFNMMIHNLGGGFKDLLFSSLFGEDSHFDSYFSNGLVQPPTSNFLQSYLQKSLGGGEQIQTKAKEHPVPVGLERIDEGEDDDS